MFCPQCGQRQSSNESRFCSSCGFQLHAVGDLLKTGGRLAGAKPAPGQLSPRSRGIRQGVFTMLSTLVIVPLMAILGHELLGLPAEVVGATAVLLMMGGFLRFIYALMFESTAAPEPQGLAQQQYVPPATPPSYLDSPRAAASLPPQQSAPVPHAYRAPRRFDTGELVPPPSVTDHTTRLLEKQPDERTNE
jgi:hypothetical protein